MNEPIKAKEFNNYSERNDYANGEELIVTITLAEYRELVRYKAVADDKYHKLYMESADKGIEIDSLKKQITMLTKQLTECKEDTEE